MIENNTFSERGMSSVEKVGYDSQGFTTVRR